MWPAVVYLVNDFDSHKINKYSYACTLVFIAMGKEGAAFRSEFSICSILIIQMIEIISKNTINVDFFFFFFFFGWARGGGDFKEDCNWIRFEWIENGLTCMECLEGEGYCNVTKLGRKSSGSSDECGDVGSTFCVAFKSLLSSGSFSFWFHRCVSCQWPGSPSRPLFQLFQYALYHVILIQVVNMKCHQKSKKKKKK